MDKAKLHSASYNRSRVTGAIENLDGLNDILLWITTGHEVVDTPDSRSTFLRTLVKMVEDYDGASYLMAPTLEVLIQELNQHTSVDVMLDILLCPLGVCAGTSRDTITGSYFTVLQESSLRGTFELM